MSGNKQHYIPQFLLRSFGLRKRNKPSRVFVYSKENGVFNTATSNIGAERHFYSAPSKDGTKTLDDEITVFENQIARSLEKIANSAANEELDPKPIAEAITHLCIRQASFRQILSQAFGKIAEIASTTFNDEDKARRAFGLDKNHATGQILEGFEELYEKHKSAMITKGFPTKEAFVKFSFTWSKANFKQNFANQRSQVDNILQGMNQLVLEVPREAHVKALRRGLAPAPRVETLAQRKWHLLAAGPNRLILPDCIAVGLDADGSSEPLIFSKEPDLIIMPLRHDLAVIGGEPNSIKLTHKVIDTALAESSWDFFVTREKSAFFTELRSTIGSSPRRNLDGMFDNIIRELNW
ncbi:MAG: DUF4238 domain-containing protein [Parvibaculum sp.]|nr:DUF4238 domain-containing protein [Parvibaculum sp.]